MSLDEVEVGDHLDGQRKQKIIVEKRRSGIIAN